MQLSCLLLNQDPLRDGRTAQLRREQRNEIPGSNALPTGASQVPLSVARSPPPRSPAQGRSGTRGGARGPAPLRGNKARRGSSWPRSERVTKAGRRCQAPRQRSYGRARRRPQRWVQFAPRFFWASVVFWGFFFCFFLVCPKTCWVTQLLSIWSCHLSSLAVLSCPLKSPPSQPAFLSTSLLLPSRFEG